MNTKQTPAPLLYAPADAAKVLGLSRAKFYELISGDAPEIPSVSIGRSRRISARALAEFVARLEAAKSAHAAE